VIPNVGHHLRVRQISQILRKPPRATGRMYNRVLMTGGGPVEGLRVIRRWSWVWTCDQCSTSENNVTSSPARITQYCSLDIYRRSRRRIFASSVNKANPWPEVA
jgi:hypothetical protein